MVFWLCLRDLSEKFTEYPFLTILSDGRFQLASFLAMGFALAWTFYAWKSSRQRMWLGTLGMGAGYVLLQ